MTSLSPTITTAILDWRGILIRVTFERQRFADHRDRLSLALHAEGYDRRSRRPAAFVEAWLDDAATSRGWVEQEAAIRQYALFRA